MAAPSTPAGPALLALDRFALSELAELVDYPGPSLRHVLAECRRHAARLPPAAAADLLAFLDWASSRPPQELEELYAATFDSNDECALEVGWHLYGEAYQRGVFLVEMRSRLRAAGIEEGSELPDHLGLVLRWLAAAAAAAEADGSAPIARDAARLVRLAVAPALESICFGLDSRRSPWLPLLRALGRAFDPRFQPRRIPRADALPQSFEGGSPAGGCR
jgi:nitrate reductase delta subunit